MEASRTRTAGAALLLREEPDGKIGVNEDLKAEGGVPITATPPCT